MINIKKVILLLMVFSGFLHAFAKEPVDYVDMFVGTSNSRWMLGPYAQEPFGMIQLGPDNQGNVWMGGYEYAINSVSGFSHIHAWTMGGLMMMPTTADLALSNPSVDSPYKGANAGYHSRIMKETEKASPGYYSVYLYDHEVTAELSATTRCGIHRYTFPEKKESRILVDLLFPTEWDYGFRVKDARITSVSDTELEGYADCQSGPWSSWNEYKLHFIIRFSKPFSRLNGWNESGEQDNIKSIAGKNDIGVYAVYSTAKDEVITVSTAISLVSIEQARLNMDAELKPLNYDFDRVVNQTRQKWNTLLGKIKVEGRSEADKSKFYTNLYRAFAGKQTWNDADGKYMDACEQVRQLETGNMYGGDAFWNTYWNLNGLWSIMSPHIIDDWVTTQLEMFKHSGWTSKGPAGLEYSGIMEGSHETALMVAAYQKGIRKDGEDIYKAVYKNVTEPGINHPCGGYCSNPLLDVYIEYGYMPMEKSVVSKTLDYAFDDWCVAQLATVLGKKKDAEYLNERSKNYKNVFHPEKKFVVRRDMQGNWDKNFDVFSNEGFIEGNSWQYSWYVPHDTEGLVELIGKDLFNSRLEDGFDKSEEHKFSAHVFDRTMGQSAEFYINHGNEVNMCTPFLFNYSGKPWLAQKWTRKILNKFYGMTPYHGWEGDEDEGQLSAWYVMAAMGLFEMKGGVEVNPGLDLASPIFDKITIQLDNQYYKGDTFIIETSNNSEENIYVQEVYLNGKALNKPRIPFSAISNGGHLLFKMGNKPNYDWYK
ncbi:MAG TPA: glycoside hydrolase family 92 protein [Dysgonomonas sp.]|nr:glycoside hydrolase family 92 protein [Dysgonomonas sp.]